MSYTFTITCNSVEEIERLLAALRFDADPAVVEQVQTQVAASGTEPPKRRGRPPRATTTEPVAPASTETAEPKGAPAEVQEAQAEPAQQPLSIDDVRQALRDLQSRVGEADMAVPLGVLSKFNASRVSEVKPEDYAAFIAACAKAG